jgi:hypothetical protein
MCLIKFKKLYLLVEDQNSSEIGDIEESEDDSKEMLIKIS